MAAASAAQAASLPLQCGRETLLLAFARFRPTHWHSTRRVHRRDWVADRRCRFWRIRFRYTCRWSVSSARRWDALADQPPRAALARRESFDRGNTSLLTDAQRARIGPDIRR